MRQFQTEILVFARYWEPGRVKTRLCPPLSLQEAATVSLCCLDLLMGRLSSLADNQTVLLFDPEEHRAAFAHRYGGARLEPQIGRDLTERLAKAVAGCTAPCLVTGSDCPTVPLSYFQQASAALKKGSDLVIGPTEDGGTYLMGLGPRHIEWLRDIPWSTPAVSDALRSRARDCSWRLHELPCWYDVDRIEDVQRVLDDLNLASNPVENPIRATLADILGRVL